MHGCDVKRLKCKRRLVADKAASWVSRHEQCGYLRRSDTHDGRPQVVPSVCLGQVQHHKLWGRGGWYLG